MNAISNLPLAARIAIPAVLVVLVAMIAMMTVFKSPAPVTVLETRDIGVFNTGMLVLKRNDVTYTEQNDGEQFQLQVTPDQEVKAAQALANTGVKDRTVMVEEIECPAPPGFTGTKSATIRSDNCETAKSVQEMLLAAGALGANVKVSQQENGTLLGPETSMNVVAQVFLPDHMKDKWNAEQAGRAISKAVGTTLDRVSITDSQLQSLFEGSSSGGAAAGGAATSRLGCGDIAGATEVETKRAAVRNCYEASIGEKLTELLGGSDRFVLVVEPTIDSNSTQVTSVRNTPGPATSRSSQRGGGQKVEDVSSPPNTVERTTVNPAGDIKSLRISVILDKGAVTEDQRIAVSSLLSSQIDAKRGDPAPVVKLAQFAGGGDVNEDLDAIKAQAETSAESSPPATQFRTTNEVPTWVTAMMALLVVGIVTAVLLLWRRSAAMAAERRRLEEAFQQEQKLFENFAQQNPDALVNDLNSLFGAPSAPEPQHRF